jgi:hypothetical protein
MRDCEQGQGERRVRLRVEEPVSGLVDPAKSNGLHDDYHEQDAEGDDDL